MELRCVTFILFVRYLKKKYNIKKKKLKTDFMVQIKYNRNKLIIALCVNNKLYERYRCT